MNTDGNYYDEAPCRKCEGCTDPFDCREYIEWIFADMRDVATRIWEKANADKSRG